MSETLRQEPGGPLLPDVFVRQFQNYSNRAEMEINDQLQSAPNHRIASVYITTITFAGGEKMPGLLITFERKA